MLRGLLRPPTIASGESRVVQKSLRQWRAVDMSHHDMKHIGVDYLARAVL
jgi:hypothetical protein